MRSSVTLSVSVLLTLSASLYAQASHPEVMVVYNSNYPDSLAVANHYLAARNIPASNLCAITPPQNDSLSADAYAQYIKTPVQNCLTSLGKQNILYIVMSYLTPWGVFAGPMGSAAVDSYLADPWDQYVNYEMFSVPFEAQPYYADAQSQGNVYLPFQSFASWRAANPATLIYDVWRMDGPSAAAASALVDQAIAAERAGGVQGQACIDRRSGDLTNAGDTGYGTGEFDLSQAANFLRQAGLTVVEDSNGEEFGTAPAPLTCPNTAFYSGWYSYYSYNDAFTWQTGSIGWHLDSASAAGGPRSGNSWAAQALQRGIAVTTGAVSEPYLQGMVRPGGAYRNLLEGASVGDAFLRNTLWLKWEIMYVGDPLYRPFGNGKPPFSPLQPVNSLSLAPYELVGGGSTTGTVQLAAAAPAGATVFTLSSSASGVTVPPSVTVPAGATTASFPISTTLVTDSAGAIITASSPSMTVKNTVTSDPLLGAFFCVTPTTMAGVPFSVVVALNGNAPVGGTTIALSSDNPAVTPPSSVTVPAGEWYTKFNVPASAVAAAVTATLTGKFAGATQTIALTVEPSIANFTASSPVAAGAPVYFTLTTGIPAPIGVTFQLTSDDPATLPVPATLTVPAGAQVVNSGAIASANASTKTVHVTVTGGGATATAAVQIQGAAPAVSVTPSSTSLSGGGTQQFTASTAVTWSIAPAVGTISSSGLYTAPATVSTQQTVTVTATSTADATKNASAIITLNPPSAPAFTPVRVNAGGPAYTDSTGTAWSADAGFTGGFPWVVSGAVSGTSSPTLYQTCRYGTFSYQYAVPNGSYTVQLKFAEVTYARAGARQFNVAINGARVLTNFDIYATAGGVLKAIDESFPITVTGGQILLEFTPGNADAPMVNGIDIEAGTGTVTTPPEFSPIRVNAGGAATTDASGNVWSEDNSFDTGATWSVGNTIAGTTNQALYQTCRYGAAFAYTFAVPNGTYNVVLKFAEPSRSGAGQRLFNASINGTQVLTNFDIFAAAGGEFTAVDKTFPITVTGGSILIQFSAGAADWPMVNGIDIEANSGTVTPPPAFSTIRVNAGGASATDGSGNAWSADHNFDTGATWSVNNTISGSTNQAIYQTCRYGPSFAYTFSVPNGSYNVVLKFAEPSQAAAGQRMFNATINSTQVLTNFDIFATAGGEFIALDRTFPVTVTGGSVAIQFAAGAAGWPMVNGIEIDNQL